MTDYKALVKRGHDYANQLADSTHIQHKGAELVGDLADAVEALVAECDALRAQLDKVRALATRLSENTEYGDYVEGRESAGDEVLDILNGVEVTD